MLGADPLLCRHLHEASTTNKGASRLSYVTVFIVYEQGEEGLNLPLGPKQSHGFSLLGDLFFSGFFVKIFR